MKSARVTVASWLMLTLSPLAVYASLAGLLNPNVYDSLRPLGLLSDAMTPGVVSQDVISVFAGVALALLSVVCLLRPNRKAFIAAVGLAGYFFYGYGLYVFQGLFTSLFVLYIAIFGLSLYSLILGLTELSHEAHAYSLPKPLRVSIAAFLFLIVAVFVPMWLTALQPFAPAHARPEMYGVLVFDLGIVMPALAITAALLLKNSPFGNALAGVALIKVFTLILSVVIGSFIQASGSTGTDAGMLAVYGVIVVISLALGVWYFIAYQEKSQNPIL